MENKVKNSLTDKELKTIKGRLNNGIQTIFVEGFADKEVYQRFYPNSKFIYNMEGFGEVIKKIRDWNHRFGKNPLVVGIIDKDKTTEEEIKSLMQENILVLGIREIEFVFLRPKVITKLFGEKTFRSFHENVLANAQNRISEQEKKLDYNEALLVLKQKVTSKYCIRLLMKEIGESNKGMNANITFLCQKMDEANAWDLVKDVIPKINEIGIEDEENKTTNSLDHIKLDYTPIPTLEQSKLEKSNTPEIEK